MPLPSKNKTTKQKKTLLDEKVMSLSSLDMLGCHAIYMEMSCGHLPQKKGNIRVDLGVIYIQV